MSEAEKLSAILSTLQEMKEEQGKMLILIRGNDLDKSDKGLAGRMNIVEGRLDEHDTKITTVKAWFVGACFGGGVIGGVSIYKLIELLK